MLEKETKQNLILHKKVIITLKLYRLSKIQMIYTPLQSIVSMIRSPTKNLPTFLATYFQPLKKKWLKTNVHQTTDSQTLPSYLQISQSALTQPCFPPTFQFRSIPDITNPCHGTNKAVLTSTCFTHNNHCLLYTSRCV